MGEEPLTAAARRVTLRDGHILASKLRALSSASAIKVRPFATKVLDFGIGVEPVLIASTSDCTLRKLRLAASLGKKASGELKETGEREKNGTCEEEPLVYVTPAGAKRSMRLYLVTRQDMQADLADKRVRKYGSNYIRDVRCTYTRGASKQRPSTNGGNFLLQRGMEGRGSIAAGGAAALGVEELREELYGSISRVKMATTRWAAAACDGVTAAQCTSRYVVRGAKA